MVWEVNVDEDILVYALRYALGRQSYAVSDVIIALEKHWEENICKKNAYVIMKDIRDYLDKANPKLDACYNDWVECLKYLEENNPYE